MSIEQRELRSKTTDVVSFVRRRGWMVVVIAALAAAVTYVVSHRERPSYQANASVLLTYQDQAGGAISKLNPLVLARQALTEAKLARITPVARRAVALAGSPRTAAQLLSESSVQSDLNDNLLQFSVKDSDPAVATKLVNLYVHAFIGYHDQLALASVRAQLTSLDSQIARLSKVLVTGPEPASQVRAQLSPLLVRRQQIRQAILSQQGGVLPVQVAQSAKRVSPQPTRDTLLGGLAGLVLGLGIALLVNGLDARIHTGRDASDQLGLPMLARIPRLPRRLRRGGVVMLAEPHGPWADAFRRLQTTVSYMQSTLGARVLLVTSPLEGEGTSTVAANLAVAMAHSGKRVVLADLNLRTPTVGARFGVPAEPGVLEALTNRIEVGGALSRVALTKGPINAHTGTLNGQAGTLTVLPAAAAAEPPAEYLNTARLADLLTVLSQHADLVVIDAPALLAVSDTMPLAFLADAILIVTRAGMANRSSLGALRASLHGCPASVLGFVLNAASGTGPASDYDGMDQPLADIGHQPHRTHTTLARDEL